MIPQNRVYELVFGWLGGDAKAKLLGIFDNRIVCLCVWFESLEVLGLGKPSASQNARVESKRKWKGNASDGVGTRRSFRPTK